MKSRDPHQLALLTLAEFAAEGRFGWGMPLVTTTLAEELGLSPTPIREALARLAGEGVIEHQPGRGYFAPSPSPADIVELYELHRRLLHWSIDELDAMESPLHSPDPFEASDRIRQRLWRLVAATRNELLSRTYRRTQAQLRPIQAVEELVSPLPADIATQVEAGIQSSDLALIRQKIDLYHDNRKSVASDVFAAMRRQTDRCDSI